MYRDRQRGVGRGIDTEGVGRVIDTVGQTVRQAQGCRQRNRNRGCWQSNRHRGVDRGTNNGVYHKYMGNRRQASGKHTGHWCMYEYRNRGLQK
jgi:hypothetical protein